MRDNFKLLVTSAMTILLFGCQPSIKQQPSGGSPLPLKYATGFQVRYVGKYKWVDVTLPYQGATEGIHYLLVPKGDSVPTHSPNVTVIPIPLESIVCTSTTHIPLLDYLGETDRLVGFPTTRYISSKRMRKRIEEGHVKDLGMDQVINYELLLSIKPSMVMSYSMGKDAGQIKKINALGIPVVINSEYLEGHPLGRAEWIKFMALFFNREKMADSVFQFIETEYFRTSKLGQSAPTRPTVVSGIVYSGTWFLPGGKNFSAKLLEDAGCHYLWREDLSTGSLQLSFEAVYARAKEADLWIGVGSFQNLHDLRTSDSRYTGFNAFQKGSIYTYNARKGSTGGSEYLELGYLRADLIMKDLVKIAHPELMKGYPFYFFDQLE